MIRPSIGAPAPEISLLDEKGQSWTLAEKLGGNVVLIFHRHIH